MADNEGWYVLKILHGPLSDVELLALAKSSQVELSSILTHETKTHGKLIEARKIRDIRQVLETAPNDIVEATIAPFEFKGDVLGETTLEDFKRRYHRNCSGHNEPAPQCSDRMHKSALGSIYAEEWFTSANVATVRIAFPFESVQKPFDDTCWFAVAGKIVTVADVKMTDLVHKFIDGLLFQILGFFDAAGFQAVRDAFKIKYGEPNESTVVPYQNAYGANFKGEQHVWNNGNCTLLLNEIAGDRESSQFICSHNGLSDEFARRRPTPATHDF